MSIVLPGIKSEIRVPVLAEIPLEKGIHKVRFIAVFKRKSHDENKKVFEELQERAKVINQSDFEELSEDDLPGMSDSELLADYLVGWKLDGADGQPIEFSEEALAEVAQVPEYRSALIVGLMECLTGKRSARAKN
tara:strand:+ start:2619 stop:3023 length:405 start_codon:yes stop_codon:yes gene_type:complete